MELCLYNQQGSIGVGGKGAGKEISNSVWSYPVFEACCRPQVADREFEFPEGFPPLAADLVNKLLVLEPEQRLGGWADG